MQFTMVGATFRPADAKDVIKALRIGDVVDLVPDSNNEYDPHAVQVLRDDVHIGFVPASENGALFAGLIQRDGDEPFTGEVIAFENTLKPVIEYDESIFA